MRILKVSINHYLTLIALQEITQREKEEEIQRNKNLEEKLAMILLEKQEMGEILKQKDYQINELKVKKSQLNGFLGKT